MASAMIAHSHSDWLSHLCKCWTNVFRNSDLQEKKTRLHRHVHESVHYGPNATLFHTSSPIPAAQTFPPTPPSTPTPSTMTSSSNWHESLPPKLSPEDMTTMKTQFEKNHPGEILDFHSTPSVRLWSLVHQHKINKAIKYIPIRRRLCHDRD